ncbi:hypothetical protein NDN16_17255 [Aureimonas altamirensis]|uniref:hypothetical protein n=1 Tax=Aureimonas altamirensis TaxID=370622 RepID=UPI0020373D8C|nr:hypothetical protein [Aureimonas altamirensis]MCM2505418.1 hypothetical protein [Aureimonas altamirensis]
MHAALRCSRPWQATIATGLALALLIPFGARAQISDEMRIGSWRLIPYEGLGPGSCLLMTNSPDKDSLIAFVNDEEKLQFGLLTLSKDLSGANRAAMDLRLDGKAAPISGIRSFDESVVLFRQAADAEPLDDLMVLTDRVEVLGRDFVARFELNRTLAALTELWQCFGTQGEPHGDVDALEAEIRAQRGIAPSTSITSGLDAAIDRMSATVPIAAQFVCEVGSSAMMGIPDISGRDQMNELTVSVTKDGSATINGTSVPAASRRNSPDGSLSLVAYEAKAVISALQGSVGSAPPVLGLSPQQLEAYQAFQGIGRQMTGMVMGNRARFMLVNLAQDAITFFDIEADDRPTNQQSPFCIRTQ